MFFVFFPNSGLFLAKFLQPGAFFLVSFFFCGKRKMKWVLGQSPNKRVREKISRKPTQVLGWNPNDQE